MGETIVEQQTLTVHTVHTNTKTSIIVITDDKLENVLDKHLTGCLQKDKWQTPLSVFLALGSIFITSDFKNAFGVPQATWYALYLIATFISGVWLLRCLVALWRYRGLDKFQLIEKIKNASDNDASKATPS